MTKRILIATIAGGLILFVWGFVAWMVLPMHMSSIHSLTNEPQVVSALRGATTVPGVYFFSSGLLIYTPGIGMTPSAAQLVRSLIFDLLSALAVAWLLSRTAAMSFAQRVLFVAIAGGVMASLIVDMNNWNWFSFPADFTIGTILDHLVGWVLAGLALAALIKPRATTTLAAA